MRASNFYLPVVILTAFVSPLYSDEPTVSYIFPAGAQRGTSVDFHIGGHYLHDRCEFRISGEGLDAPKELSRGESNLWFEGPRIPLPASQRKEDYPWPQLGKLTVSPDATLGVRHWRVRTAQGMTGAMAFVVGDLPEIVEQEVDGKAVPTEVQLPVTINGRIFPREDVDLWTFSCRKGHQYVCEVLASRIGSPLDSRLQITGPDGRRVAENVDSLGADSRVTFVARQNGLYQVRIDDANFRGLQNYVYRLTITAGPHAMGVYPLGGQGGAETTFHWLGANLPSAAQQAIVRLPTDSTTHSLALAESNSLPVKVDVSSYPELIESLDGKRRASFASPRVINGRLTEREQEDVWQFDAEQGESFLFEVRAARLGSPLDATLQVKDAEGKVLGENADGHPSGDPKLKWKAPRQGRYQLVITDGFADHNIQRTHPDSLYCYRVVCESQATATDKYDFELTVATDTLNVPLGGAAELQVQVARRSNFPEPIEVEAIGLPPGATCEKLILKKGARKAKWSFQLAQDSPLELASVQLRATVQPAKDDKPPKDDKDGNDDKNGRVEAIQRLVTITSQNDDNDNRLTLVPAIPTPFKFVGEFETKYGACGSLFRRSFRVERNGFEGPLRVRLAERQVRHLQGVTGEEVVVPAGEDSFEFTIRLAPWMEVGRTSRTCLMIVGDVAGPDGQTHTVSYTSQAQNDQIIVLIDPSPLSVTPAVKSLAPEPGSEIQLPIRIARGSGVRGDVRVEVVAPQHYNDFRSEPIVVPRDQAQGTLTLRFGSKTRRFNAPLKIRATTQQSPSYVAETKVEL